MRRASLLTALLACSICTLQAAADTITVDLNGGGDYVSIQEGLNAAGDGDTVLVAEGQYSGTNNNELDFHGFGISLSSVPGPGSVTITGSASRRAFVFDDGEDSLAVVEGFGIISCAGDTGAGALIIDSSPTFKDCNFGYCSATDVGGGVAVLGGNPVFDSCTFHENSSRDGGAAALVNASADFLSCWFFTNHASAEGGAARVLGSRADFLDCEFHDNEASSGGALSLRRPGAVTVTRCSFLRNESSSYGAAIHMYGCSPTISDCRFERNEPTGGGTVWGEYSSPTMSRCTFWNNKGSYDPDIGHDVELYHTDIGDALIEDCTFCGWRINTRDLGALLRFGDCEPLIRRSIIAFYNHGPGVTCTGTGEPTIRRCVVYGNVGGDEVCGDDPYNNMALDPLFCGFWDGDLTLCANSPCLPQYNPWGVVVGAHDVGCSGCDTPVEHTSWGMIKAMYR